MNAIIGNKFCRVLFTGALLGLAGCASGPDVRADFDPSVDFSAYKTFAYVNPLGTDRNGYQSIVSQYLKAATQRELEARGLQYVETAPQLLVNFNARLNDKIRVDPIPARVTFPYYGYRRGAYTSWPQYGNEQHMSSYTEGTLNIDVIDVAKKQLIWEGTAVGAVTQKALDNIQMVIDVVVAATFQKYPAPSPAKPK